MSELLGRNVVFACPLDTNKPCITPEQRDQGVVPRCGIVGPLIAVDRTEIVPNTHCPIKFQK